MKLHRQPQFDRDYQKLPIKIKTKLHRQLKAISKSLRHPSLHAKKIQGHSDIWEARVDRFYRFTFKIIADIIYLRRVGTHDKTLTNP